MAATFTLIVITPEHEFFYGQAEAITVPGLDGELTVLANHAPMVASLDIGQLNIKVEGSWFEAFNSEGFMEVLDNKVVVFVQSCERPEEIDIRRAEEAKRRAEEQLRQKQSVREHNETQIALTRAMTRLRVAGNRLR